MAASVQGVITAALRPVLDDMRAITEAFHTSQVEAAATISAMTERLQTGAEKFKDHDGRMVHLETWKNQQVGAQEAVGKQTDGLIKKWTVRIGIYSLIVAAGGVAVSILLR